MENITKFSLYAIYLLLFLGAFSFNYENRTILGISPSLSSSIFNYGSICSLYLYHKTKKKYHLFSLILLFVLNFGFSSLRGIFSIFIGSLAYLKVFNSKNNINFYLKIFLTILVIIIIYIFIVMNSNIVIHTPYFSKNKFIFVHQFLKNSHSLKYTITDIFVNKNFNFSDYEYVGERLSAIFIGIKETLINSPLIGFGHCNTAGILSLMENKHILIMGLLKFLWVLE